MTVRTPDQFRTPPSLHGVPPRYQVFDRRTVPPQTVARFYFEPGRESVVFEVYDDAFREFLKRAPSFVDRHFDWAIDVDPDAPPDPRDAIVRPDPMPALRCRGAKEDERLTLDKAVESCRAVEYYRVIETSDPR